MSKESLVLILGIIVLIVPSSGLPDDWVIYILRAAGVLIILLGFLLRRCAYYRRIDNGGKQHPAAPFVESHNEVAENSKK